MMTSTKILKGARIGVGGGPRGPHCGCRGSLADTQLRGQSTPSSTRASPESGRSRQRQNHPDPTETEPPRTDREMTQARLSGYSMDGHARINLQSRGSPWLVEGPEVCTALHSLQRAGGRLGGGRGPRGCAAPSSNPCACRRHGVHRGQWPSHPALRMGQGLPFLPSSSPASTQDPLEEVRPQGSHGTASHLLQGPPRLHPQTPRPACPPCSAKPNTWARSPSRVTCQMPASSPGSRLREVKRLPASHSICHPLSRRPRGVSSDSTLAWPHLRGRGGRSTRDPLSSHGKPTAGSAHCLRPTVHGSFLLGPCPQSSRAGGGLWDPSDLRMVWEPGGQERGLGATFAGGCHREPPGPGKWHRWMGGDFQVRTSSRPRTELLG